MVIKAKYAVILLHLGFWISFVSLPLLITPQNMGHPGLPQLPQGDMSILFWFQFTFIIFFYFNSDFLIPRLLTKGKLFPYGFSVALSMALILVLFYLLSKYILQWPDSTPFPALFPLLIIFGLSCGYRYFVSRNREEQIRKDKDFENVKSELYFLRSQISPHFIFNVLNNMVSLARKNSDLIEPILIKLSELMRYILYETSRTVQLDTEITYLQSYIDLQILRFGDKVPVSFNVAGATERFDIEPMLLIPLVENAFKHGMGFRATPLIVISANVSTTGELLFTVLNRYEHVPQVKTDTESGIGLKNLQRRLNLLYANRHKLSLSKEDDFFTATLSLQL